jgi:hypothetical protein
MSTLEAILKEMKEVPVNRLDELYQFIHSITKSAKHSEKIQKKIISFGGAFNDMSSKDYTEFLDYTKETRADLFDRKFEI